MTDVRLKMFDAISIRIETEDSNYLSMIKNEFTKFAPNYRFTPLYRSGNWDGRICMVDKLRSTFPYGILIDYVRIHKRMFPRHTLEIENEVKALFKGPDIKMVYDLKLLPRLYQIDCIEASIKHTKGIIRSATASGKSLVIAYIIRNLMRVKEISNAIIIVPTTALITQFYQDLIDYGFEPDDLGAVFSERKQWDKKVVISTWQSLAKVPENVNNYGCIFVDETHQSKSHEIKKILAGAKTARYRLGFTGTLHSAEIENWNVKAYLGPIIREYSAGLLADQGWIAKCTVNMIGMNYTNDNFGDLTHHEVRDNIFARSFRLDMLKTLVNKLNHNVLLLVDRVEKEGEVLERYLKANGCTKEVVFLSGRDDVELRESWRLKCMKESNICLIATYGIFQLGINIPNLKYVVLASPFKAKIRILQSIGRALRKHASKEEEGAQIFDIHDYVRFFDRYGNVRKKYYASEKFEVKEEVSFTEGDLIDLLG